MEHDNMARDYLDGQQAVAERKQPRDPRIPAPRLPQDGPPLVNEGLEAPRSAHC
jgi:hypothetical protein